MHFPVVEARHTFLTKAETTIASNGNGRGCFSAGTAVNCGHCSSLANGDWPDAVILEFGIPNAGSFASTCSSEYISLCPHRMECPLISRLGQPTTKVDFTYSITPGTNSIVDELRWPPTRARLIKRRFRPSALVQNAISASSRGV